MYIATFSWPSHAKNKPCMWKDVTPKKLVCSLVALVSQGIIAITRFAPTALAQGM